ncbi:MAG: helix-turn-helix transcriptional regulator [Cytophagales bacterium]|nr:helix-turn-helix transcriptional regulator [Cytophagales bacterium]
MNLGRKIRHMRELLNFTQEDVAEKLGVSQQTVSNIESNETVDHDQLEKMARALGVSAQAIKDLDENAAVYNIVVNNDQSSASNFNNNCTFNPLDKLMEVIEKNEKLYEALIKEKEALLKSEQEKTAMMERFLEERKGS